MEPYRYTSRYCIDQLYGFVYVMFAYTSMQLSDLVYFIEANARAW